MTVDQVEASADRVLDQLPPELAEAIGEVTIHVARDRQDVEVLRSAVSESGQASIEIPQDFRALFMGTPIDPAADPEAVDVEPVRGVILLNAALLRDDPDVLHTLLHEIGHCLGYDEDEIAALGLE